MSLDISQERQCKCTHIATVCSMILGGYIWSVPRLNWLNWLSQERQCKCTHIATVCSMIPLGVNW